MVWTTLRFVKSSGPRELEETLHRGGADGVGWRDVVSLNEGEEQSCKISGKR